MDNEFPTSISQIDYANLKAAISEEKANRAIIALLELQYQNSKNELKSAELIKEKVLQELRDKYQLFEGDSITPDGTIVRAKR